jgi:hypothetical protein
MFSAIELPKSKPKAEYVAGGGLSTVELGTPVAVAVQALTKHKISTITKVCFIKISKKRICCLLGKRPYAKDFLKVSAYALRSSRDPIDG